MDLSKLSDADLMALKSGDLSQLSDEALVSLRGAPQESGGFLQGAGNVAAGLVRGAGSIGATILAPYDYGMDYIKGDRGKNLSSLITGKELPSRNAERRAAMDEALGSMGAQTDSLAYQGSKLVGEIAGTAGAGGVVANGATRALPALARFAPGAASKALPFIDAIRSGGMVANGANMATRTAGGAVSGAATAGLANPEDVLNGAVFGGALPGAVKTAGVAGDLLRKGITGTAKNTVGLMSGVGGESISTAYQAGKSGGTNFLDNMRGKVPMTDVLDDAKAALTKMRLDRGAQYRSGMVDIASDKAVLDFAPIDSAVASIKSMGSFKGQVINKNAAGSVDEIADLVTQWKALDPKEFHTPEGLDALKKAIGDIRDAAAFGSPGRKAADTAYNAVKSQITSQAPTYSKVMGDYSAASDTLSEIERALSLGHKASADTSMRKLQSLMRNNVNTNYGNRLDLARTLEGNGAEILPAVAGQAMTSWTPRGMAGATATPLAAMAAYANPAALAALPMTSPRMVGEAAYGLGALSRGASTAGGASSQTLANMMQNANMTPITMNRLAPLLAATPILAANQR